MRVYAMKAKFTGLYEWGTGWLSTKIADAWHSYFKEINKTGKFSFWTYFERGRFSTSEHLISVDANVFLHPMYVVCVCHSSTVTKRVNEKGEMVEVFPEVEELKEILTGAANACGGMVEFSDMVFGNIEDPMI